MRGYDFDSPQMMHRDISDVNTTWIGGLMEAQSTTWLKPHDHKNPGHVDNGNDIDYLISLIC